MKATKSCGCPAREERVVAMRTVRILQERREGKTKDYRRAERDIENQIINKSEDKEKESPS